MDPKNHDERQAALARFWTWKIVSTVILAWPYLAMVSEGWRAVFPVLGRRHGLDLAHVMAIAMMIATWHFADFLLLAWLGENRFFQKQGWEDPDAYKRFVVNVGILLLVADCGLLYIGLIRMGWGRSIVSVPAILGTCGYLGVLLFVSFVSVQLRKPLS